MGYQIGYDENWKRDIGYGVPDKSWELWRKENPKEVEKMKECL